MAASRNSSGLPRSPVLDLQRLIRSLPKVVIALVAGYAIGGGQVLPCSVTSALAAETPSSQSGPRVGELRRRLRGEIYLARWLGNSARPREIVVPLAAS